MAQKELSSTKGLVIANTVLVVNGSSVGIGTATPSYSLHVATTDAAKMPVGNTAQRPANSAGLIRYNTDQSDFELVRSAGTWETFNSIVSNTSAAESAIASRSSNTQVLFNDSTNVAGSAGLTFNKTSNNLTVSNSVLATVVNGATISVGSNFAANSTGVYHTGVVNGATISVGTSFVANSTGTYHSGLANASQFVIPNALTANSTGLYHNGILYGNSLSVSNSTAQILFANATTFSYTSNASFTGTLFSLGTWLSVNSTMVNYPTGQVNAATGSFGGGITANSTKFVIGTSVGFQANGTVGTSGQVLKSNGTTVYWAADATGVNQVSSGNGLTGGPITDTGTISVLANNGITANSTGLFAFGNTGLVVNATGIHVNSSYIGSISSNNASYLGGVAAANYARTNANNVFSGGFSSFTYTVANFTAVSATANGYGMVGSSTNNTFGGVLGYSANHSYYGILGFQDTFSFFGNGNIYTAGDLQVTGNMTGYFSDIRLKKEIKPIKNALDKLKEITGVFYQHNETAEKHGFEDKSEQVGVIAQDVKRVLPHAIAPAPFDMNSDGSSKTGENYMTVRMEKLLPLIIEAIKDLDQKINDLTSSK